MVCQKCRLPPDATLSLCPPSWWCPLTAFPWLPGVWRGPPPLPGAHLHCLFLFASPRPPGEPAARQERKVQERWAPSLRSPSVTSSFCPNSSGQNPRWQAQCEAPDGRGIFSPRGGTKKQGLKARACLQLRSYIRMAEPLKGAAACSTDPSAQRLVDVLPLDTWA